MIRLHRRASALAALVLSFFVVACGGGSAESPGGANGSAMAPMPDVPPGPQSVSSDPPPADTAGKIQWALDGMHRAPEHRARDRYRHPLETLTFFGLRDDMTVVELYPGRDGWYTEILAPVLRDKGKLVVTNYKNPPGAAFDHKLQSSRPIYDRVDVRYIMPPQDVPIGADGSADLVLTFRNIHNWMIDGDAEAMFAAAFKVLKHGGVLGVVEHRAPPQFGDAQTKQTGYVTEEKVLALGKAAGFVLDAKSEINANPKDTKIYPNGVWSLPPTLRGGATDRERYLAIGESDRMTIRFKKP